MGTNYYWHKNTCPTCGHSKEVFHIGKSSGGWTFSFQALRDYESPNKQPVLSVKDWKKVMRSKGSIYDEYGALVSRKEFWALVQRKKEHPGAQVHATYVKKDYPGTRFAEESWLDEEGNSFSLGEFS